MTKQMMSNLAKFMVVLPKGCVCTHRKLWQGMLVGRDQGKPNIALQDATMPKHPTSE
jgi:hypothetical protein